MKIASDRGDRRVDDASNIGQRTDQNDAVRPAVCFVTFGEFRNCIVTVIESHPPSAGDERAPYRERSRKLCRR